LRYFNGNYFFAKIKAEVSEIFFNFNLILIILNENTFTCETFQE